MGVNKFYIRPEQITELAHLSHTGLNVLFEWDLSEIYFWHTEHVKLHNRLNTPSG